MAKQTFKRPHDSHRFSGPQDDHTLQNLQGSYLYYIFSYTPPRRGCSRNETEIQLESSLLDLTTKANFSFWYVLKGWSVGHLHLFGKNGLKLWDSSVNHTGSEYWTQASVQLDSGVYRLTFKASCKHAMHNDIAIDDIVLKGEPLGTMTTAQYDETTALPLETSTEAEFSRTKRPTTRKTGLSLPLETTTTVESGGTKKPTIKTTACCVHTQVSCSFEDGPCGWHNVSDDPQQGWGIWHMAKQTIKLPHDSTLFSGPYDDHTLQSAWIAKQKYN
ncbi:MAM and LDL-receptor class A domain-containing protein 2-like [Lingula anatina]|uniref:MAM and LDL-receptor class A domain-containing protein 2-like n=1 Tax=Lingula anatina TaxID=7574 RepID=A0A1S3JVK6_LINAN|nr:MAM and LDL-receptor class A domain-containing protein 2-like [Lingula anatina]|eukprot:XP_013414403.1 MAM and LDL-receptor class A domain-containing protein 2-like [Lingula anatina]